MTSGATGGPPTPTPGGSTSPGSGGRPAFPAKAGDTSKENPWPVRALAQRMAEYVNRAPAAWIEGQIAQVGRSGGAATVFLTLRDAAADISLSVTCSRGVLTALPVQPTEGSRVVVHGRFEFYAPRGTLSFRIDEIHPVGLGELLARLERLRRLLAVEGLTAPERKRRLPFLPRTVGLITGKASAAESDVLTHARGRWPAVRFRIENPAVQGISAVTQMIAALQRLDADPAVDVIVVARGGGSTEDLLPFSDEALCRAVVACRTPVVSAIGHEPDHPIIDDVADIRCSTPTDAGKRVVPDADAERRGVHQLQDRARRALSGWVDREAARLSRLTAATVLADPIAPLDRRAEHVDHHRSQARTVITSRLDRHDAELAHRRAQLAALGPAATLARGYAVVQFGARVLRSIDDAPVGTGLRIRFADGAIGATSTGPRPLDEQAANPARRISR